MEDILKDFYSMDNELTTLKKLREVLKHRNEIEDANDTFVTSKGVITIDIEKTCEDITPEELALLYKFSSMIQKFEIKQYKKGKELSNGLENIWLILMDLILHI